MKTQALPKRTLLLWQFRVVMLTSVFVAISLYLSYLSSVLYWVALAFSLLGFAVIVFYLPLFFGRYEIFTKNDAVIINYGVFIKISHIMPYSRLIYAQTFATPLARLFGVTAVSLKAARSRVIVPEIKLEKAEKIMKQIVGEVQNG